MSWKLSEVIHIYYLITEALAHSEFSQIIMMSDELYDNDYILIELEL